KPEMLCERENVPPGRVSLLLSRAVGEGVHEDIDITNHALARVGFNLEIAIRSDFADLFEVRADRLVRRGHISQAWNDATAEMKTRYVNGDFDCELDVRMA